MDASEDGGPQELRVAEIRAEVEMLRLRIAEALDALGYKVDVPARLGDMLSSTAANVTSRLLQHVPTTPRNASDSTDTSVVADTPSVMGETT